MIFLVFTDDDMNGIESGGSLVPRLFPTSPTAAATPSTHNDPPPLGQPYSGDVCNYGPIYNAAYNYAAAMAASKAVAAASRASPYSRGAFSTSPCTSSPTPTYQPPSHLHHHPHPFGASYGAGARTSAFEYPPR
jgi:hypothetical protein